MLGVFGFDIRGLELRKLWLCESSWLIIRLHRATRRAAKLNIDKIMKGGSKPSTGALGEGPTCAPETAG